MGIILRTISWKVESQSIDEFTFAYDESAPEFIVDYFNDWLSIYIANDANFSDEQTLQFGYTILHCEVRARTLRLLAPDFRRLPIEWTEDLGPAFRLMATHKYIPESFGFTPDIPSLSNTAIVGCRFDEIPMFADRLTPLESNPNDSGWFIGSECDDVDNNDPQQLRLISLHEATLAVPHLIEFLSLPIGCQVMFSGGNPVILKNYEEMEVPEGSDFDQRRSGWGQIAE